MKIKRGKLILVKVLGTTLIAHDMKLQNREDLTENK